MYENHTAQQSLDCYPRLVTWYSLIGEDDGYSDTGGRKPARGTSSVTANYSQETAHGASFLLAAERFGFQS